jgi:hypothetical protein
VFDLLRVMKTEYRASYNRHVLCSVKETKELLCQVRRRVLCLVDMWSRLKQRLMLPVTTILKLGTRAGYSKRKEALCSVGLSEVEASRNLDLW